MKLNKTDQILTEYHRSVHSYDDLNQHNDDSTLHDSSYVVDFYSEINQKVNV